METIALGVAALLAATGCIVGITRLAKGAASKATKVAGGIGLGVLAAALVGVAAVCGILVALSGYPMGERTAPELTVAPEPSSDDGDRAWRDAQDAAATRAAERDEDWRAAMADLDAALAADEPQQSATESPAEPGEDAVPGQVAGAGSSATALGRGSVVPRRGGMTNALDLD